MASFGAPARDCGHATPAGRTVQKTGGCDTHAVEHADGSNGQLGGCSNRSMGARLDALVAPPEHYCRVGPVRPARRRIATPDTRNTFRPPSKGRGACPKLLGTLPATVTAAPVALAVRRFHGITSYPKTLGRVLVYLAMLSTASGWKLPSLSAEPEMTNTGEAHEPPIMDHGSPITGGVDVARDKRRLMASGCNSSWCAWPPRPCSPPPA